MINRILLLILIICLAACARLDDDLFEPTRVSSYQLDNYQGDTDITVDDPVIANVTEFQLDSYDGKDWAKLAALFIGDQTLIGDPGYTVILYCHGNAEHMDYYWPRTKLLANMDPAAYGVMTLDYRGYGKSQGTPSEDGLYADVTAAIRWLEEQGLQSANFIMYGYSLGTGPVVELTAHPRTNLVPDKIILEAPFASVEVMIQDASLLAMPGSYVTDLKINNADKIKNVAQPLLWLHGTDDDFLQIDNHGELVFKNHPGVDGVDKFASRVAGASHDNIPVKLGTTPLVDYSTVIDSFISAP